MYKIFAGANVWII